MARLIVNADDLGLTAGVNRAIARAHSEGIVTSATLMANSQAFDDAVTLARNLPSLGIGCHLVLVDGAPLSPAFSISSLCSDTKRFRSKLWQFAIDAMRGRISSREVELECTAQIAKLQRAGIAVTHVDCHKHTHMFPSVLEGVLRAAAGCNVPAIRNPFEPSFARRASIALSSRNCLRSIETAVLSNMYATQFTERVRRFGLVTTEGSVGVTITGTLDATLFWQTLKHLPSDGIYEFVCHPGYNDGDLATAGTRLLNSRETELAVLCSPEARETLNTTGATLINFRQLTVDAESKPAVDHPMP